MEALFTTLNGHYQRVAMHSVRQFAGRDFDRQLLAELPPEVDPCGEKGEFHTFVSAGPMFRHPIGFQLGEQVEREGFVFADLQLPPSESGDR